MILVIVSCGKTMWPGFSISHFPQPSSSSLMIESRAESLKVRGADSDGVEIGGSGDWVPRGILM